LPRTSGAVERIIMTTNSYPVSWVGVAILSSIALAVPDSRAANVSVSPSSGPGNALVTATSSGFHHDVSNEYALTEFYLNDSLAAECPHDPPIDNSNPALANCQVSFRTMSFPGTWTIRAANSFGESATTTYTVVKPTFSLSPSCGPAGTVVTAKGHQFAAVD